VPGWRKLVADNAKIVKGLTVGSVPLSRAMLIGLGRGEIMVEDRVTHAKQVIVAALALLLIDAGWRAETTPGEQIVLRRSGAGPISFGELLALVSGEKTSVILELPSDCSLVGAPTGI